ncbi:MAG: universal stress protein [Desulfovibrionaceae bacterium]
MPMPKELLVTISDEASALYGVRFCAAFFKKKKLFKCTLLYIAPNVASGLSLLETQLAYQELKQRQAMATARGFEALERAREMFVQSGVPDTNITLTLKHAEFGTAWDIIEEGVRGKFDAVVLGRRGLSRLGEYLDGSVSKTVATSGMDIPIWLCHMPDTSRSGVLLCVDGSEASLRVADHVGYMVAGERSHSVRLLYVVSPPKNGGDAADGILSGALDALQASGVEASRVVTEVVESNDVAQTILAELARGRYAAVAVGRTGGDAHPVRRFFVGSVGRQLINAVSDAALWICH